MSYYQPLVGDYLFNSDSTGIFPARIVGSWWRKGLYICEYNNLTILLVEADAKFLEGWSGGNSNVGEYAIINSNYLVGVDTPLMRELL